MKFPAFEISKALPLRNKDYFIFLLDAISAARFRIWATIFLVDITVLSDQRLYVRKLINNLVYANWRNVDVRLILGKSKIAPLIQNMNLTSARYIKDKGINVRIFHSAEDSSTHSKYVIIDHDLIILGSHNWSHGGFSQYIEDSIAVHSKNLCRNLEEEFLESWNSSLEV